MAVFTTEQREQLRAKLVASAQKDARLTGAAHLGSAAKGALDRWSDIDLALCLAPGSNLSEVSLEWTDKLYREYDAIAHHDVKYGNTLYRVYLLKNTLQVDLSFWLHDEFAAIGPDFKLIFGGANASRVLPAPVAKDLIGMAWLYALHVRSSIARNRFWQAEYMLSGMRDQVLALASLRNGLSTTQARGTDDLPPELTNRVAEGLVRSLDTVELVRAFHATMNALLHEIEHADAELAKNLAQPLQLLVDSSGSASTLSAS